MTTINGRDMVLLIDGLDRSDECTTVTFGYGARQTFADMRGTTPKLANMTVLQELEATSLYRMAMASDTDPVAGVIKPLGNAAPSATAPHWTFNIKPVGISGDAFMGGEAAEDASEGLTVDLAWIISDWAEVTA
jgi:hypothetical protein